MSQHTEEETLSASEIEAHIRRCRYNARCSKAWAKEAYLEYKEKKAEHAEDRAELKKYLALRDTRVFGEET